MLESLYSLFRKRDINPATNLAAANRWISSLPLQDEYEAHHMLVDTLNAFNSSTEPLDQERLQVLMRLDESCQASQRSLCRQYFKNQVVFKHAEKALWKEIVALYLHLAHAYRAFVRLAIDGEFSPFLPLLTGRALHYFGREVKWRYFHGERVEPNMWKRLHKLYRIAEAGGFAHDQFELAGGVKTTCGSEYARTLLLDLLAPASLQAAEVEMLDHLLGRWAQQVTLDREAAPARHSHFVDLLEGAGCGRLAVSGEGGDKFRYLDVRGVAGELERLVDGLRGGDALEQFSLQLDCPLPCSHDFLEEIADALRRGAASRAFPREKIQQPVEVACGLAGLKARLKPGSGEAEPGAPEYWLLDNESERGAGLRADKPGSPNPVAGDLIGMRSLGNRQRWEIGAVRWVSHSETGGLALGMEKLSHSPRLVEIRTVENPLGAPGSEGDAGQAVEALFLPRVDDHGMASSLLLPDAVFSSGRLLDLFDSNVIYRIRLSTLLEQGADWGRVKFDILGRRQT